MSKEITIDDVRRKRQKEKELIEQIFSKMSLQERMSMLFGMFRIDENDEESDIEGGIMDDFTNNPDFGEEKQDNESVSANVSYICLREDKRTKEKLEVNSIITLDCVNDLTDLILQNTAIDKKTKEAGAILSEEDLEKFASFCNYPQSEIKECFDLMMSINFIYTKDKKTIMFGMFDSSFYDKEEKEYVFFFNRDYFKYVLPIGIYELYKPFIEKIFRIRDFEVRWLVRWLLLSVKFPVKIKVDSLLEEAYRNTQKLATQQDAFEFEDYDKFVNKISEGLKRNIFLLRSIGIDYNPKKREITYNTPLREG